MGGGTHSEVMTSSDPALLRLPMTGVGHAWRAAATAVVGVVAVPAAVAAFFALIVGSGCFLSCSEAHPAGGFGLGLVALLLVLAAPVTARLLWRRWPAFWLAVTAQVLGVLVAIAGTRLLSV